MYYPRFTKAIIQHFISKDKSISMRNILFMHTVQDDSVLGSLRFVSKTEEYQVYGALILAEMTNLKLQKSPAYKTYLAYDTTTIPPKKARKFKKLASPLKNKTLVAVEEPTEKPAKKPAARRQSTGGSSDGAGLEPEVPDEQKGKSTNTSQGTGLILGVPDVSKAVSFEIERNRARKYEGKMIMEMTDCWYSRCVARESYSRGCRKKRAFWSLNEDILKINDSDYQYAVSIKEDTAYPCLHSPKTTKETSSIRRIQRRPIRRIEDIVKINDPNITMEEYIRLEEEKALKRGKVFNWKTAKYGKIWYDEDIHTSDLVLFDDSDDEDYTPTVSCFDDLDFFKDFENEFPAIVYNNAQTSKSDLLTEPILNPQHIDEFNLKDETSLSECDEEEQNVLNFNDLFPFNVIYPNDSKSDKDNDDDKVDIEHSSGDLSVKPLPDVINTDVGAYAHGSNKLLETRMLINLFNNLYVPFGIPFDPKLFYKDGIKFEKLT
ncbi:hypothetical protein Tco_0385153 [Tanacetum coccineum]